MKKALAGLLAILALTTSTAVYSQPIVQQSAVTVSAAEQTAAANPVISRGVPAYSGGGTASYGNDKHYHSSK